MISLSLKILILVAVAPLSLLMILLLLASQKAQAAPLDCQLVPVGQIADRALEIQKELIFMLSQAEKEYAKMLTLAPEMVKLIRQCDVSLCHIDQDSCLNNKLCTPEKCEVKGPCGPPQTADDICPTEVREKINKLFEEIKKPYNDATRIVGRAAAMLFELNLFKGRLTSAKQQLAKVNPTTHFLVNCNQAKSGGLVRLCNRYELRLLGLEIPFPISQPVSPYDYLICELKALGGN